MGLGWSVNGSISMCVVRRSAVSQGGILQDNFEEEKAIECFNRTIQIDPEYADAHYK